MLAGMFLRLIEGNLNVAGGWRKMPRETSAGVAGFEAAIPKQRAGRIGRRRILHDRYCFLPRMGSVGNASWMNECVNIKKHLRHRVRVPQRDQAAPYYLCVTQIADIG